jgi:hypothetical protein
MVPGHAYSIFGAKKVGNNYLYQVRNPWGLQRKEKDGYKTKPWFKQVDKAAADKLMTFWIDETDFYNFFKAIEIAHFNDGYQAESSGFQTITKTKDWFILKVDIKVNGTNALTVC